MNTFDNFFKGEENFFYQRGMVTTNKPWDKPTYTKLKDFLTKINDATEIFNQFECYLIGGVLFDFQKTWDVDIMMKGHIQSYQELESCMNIMYDVALNEYKLLLDIQWLNQDIPQFSLEQITSSDFKAISLKYVKIGYAKKIIGNDISETDLRVKPNVKKVTEYLIEGYYDEIPNLKNKLYHRIISNPNKILRTQFDVKTFINTDEEFFLKNTNRN